MMNWYDMNESGRERHAALIAEAHTFARERAALLPAHRSNTLRARLAETLITWGRWLDNQPHRETEREGASVR